MQFLACLSFSETMAWDPINAINVSSPKHLAETTLEAPKSQWLDQQPFKMNLQEERNMANCVNSTTFYVYHTAETSISYKSLSLAFGIWKIDNECMYALFFLHLELTYQMVLLVPNKIQAKCKAGNNVISPFSLTSLFPPFPQQPNSQAQKSPIY